jgi:hypothetical protein
MMMETKNHVGNGELNLLFTVYIKRVFKKKKEKKQFQDGQDGYKFKQQK